MYLGIIQLVTFVGKTWAWPGAPLHEDDRYVGQERLGGNMYFVSSGNAERSLELMVARVKSRVAFGKPLVDQVGRRCQKI